MSPAVHGGGPRWKSFEYNTLLSVEPFREERIMDANRYFTAMHNAMSSRLPGAQLLAAVRLQDLCGNDAYLEVRRMPGEHCATVCYSTMGRRGLNFQLFRKGWMLCHNESGQLTGQFPAKAESLLEDTDFHACCREDRLDAARTDRMVQELETLAGTDCDLPLPRDARTGPRSYESRSYVLLQWEYRPHASAGYHTRLPHHNVQPLSGGSPLRLDSGWVSPFDR